MSLKGNLDPTFLSSLFQIFSDEKKTGLFTADCDGLRVDILICDGVIVHATGLGKTPVLADILIYRGILPAEQVDKTIAAAEPSGNHICRTLVDLGFMDEGTVVSILEELARDMLLCLFQQTQGEFEYTDLELATDKMVLIQLDIRQAIFNTFRLLDELVELKKKLPEDDIQFAIVEAGQNKSFQLDAVAWRVLSLIHGKQPLKEIIRQSSYNAHVVYTALLALLDAGMITFSATWEDDIHSVDHAPDSKEQAAPAEAKPKDKGLFGFFKKR